LPKRILGRTKEKVSILGLGTAPVGEGPIGVQDGIKIFGEAIDRGIGKPVCVVKRLICEVSVNAD